MWRIENRHDWTDGESSVETTTQSSFKPGIDNKSYSGPCGGIIEALV